MGVSLYRGIFKISFRIGECFFVEGLKYYKFKLVWARSLIGVKAFEQFFYANGGNLHIRQVWAGFEGGFVPGSSWGGRGMVFARIL